jgi:hypothetical protein
MRDRPFWFNFRKSIDPRAWPNDELKRMHNANLVIPIPSGEDPYIEFENESDATFFLLRHA